MSCPLEGNGNTKFFYVMGAWGYSQAGHRRLAPLQVVTGNGEVRQPPGEVSDQLL